MLVQKVKRKMNKIVAVSARYENKWEGMYEINPLLAYWHFEGIISVKEISQKAHFYLIDY